MNEIVSARARATTIVCQMIDNDDDDFAHSLPSFPFRLLNETNLNERKKKKSC